MDDINTFIADFDANFEASLEMIDEYNNLDEETMKELGKAFIAYLKDRHINNILKLASPIECKNEHVKDEIDYTYGYSDALNDEMDSLWNAINNVVKKD